jgi:hypothetical protein
MWFDLDRQVSTNSFFRRAGLRGIHTARSLPRCNQGGVRVEHLVDGARAHYGTSRQSFSVDAIKGEYSMDDVEDQILGDFS